jgi:hypothetical protein
VPYVDRYFDCIDAAELLYAGVARAIDETCLMKSTTGAAMAKRCVAT